MDGGSEEASNLLFLARLAGGCPVVGLERSAGGGGLERLAGDTDGPASEVIFV